VVKFFGVKDLDPLALVGVCQPAPSRGVNHQVAETVLDTSRPRGGRSGQWCDIPAIRSNWCGRYSRSILLRPPRTASVTTAGYATALCWPWLNQVYRERRGKVSGPQRQGNHPSSHRRFSRRARYKEKPRLPKVTGLELDKVRPLKSPVSPAAQPGTLHLVPRPRCNGTVFHWRQGSLVSVAF
jgi:hypothetical protein